MDARGEGRGVGPARGLPVLVVVTLLAAGGCRGAGETTDKMVPRGWRGNPWGPAANAARARGEIPVVPNNPEMTAWESWGRQNLREGDIVFRMGDARAAFGLFPFSKISAAIAASRYSHTGIVAVEGGELVVYDTSTSGPQRQPFPIWVLDTRGHFAVKRPRAPYSESAPKAVAFCRSVYEKQVPFDFNMSLGDDKFYCIELTERSYTTAGLPLSKPLRLDHLPRYAEFPRIVRLMKLATSMVPQQLAYVIGNDAIGIWSSPSLELVYEAPHAKPPLAADPAPESLTAQAPRRPGEAVR
jgi:Permuted papain-like amidase enzyme, YaeF/YiiX, C92 family